MHPNVTRNNISWPHFSWATLYMHHSSTAYALLETISAINQALVHFIDVMNLLDQLLHFSHIFAVSRVHICAAGWQKVW